MDRTNLTVRVPRNLLEGAKQFANEHNTTLTRLVSEYLRQLSAEDDSLALAPVVRRLSGVLSQDASVDDHHKHLEEKHVTQT